MTTFFAFKTRFRSEQEMLMNEKNKEMERWSSLVMSLSSILLFVFVCLFVCNSFRKEAVARSSVLLFERCANGGL